MIRLLPVFFHLMLATFLAVCFLVSTAFSSPVNSFSEEDKEKLKQSFSSLLRDIDAWALRFPPAVSKKLHQQIETQKNNRLNQPLYSNTVELLSWFSEQFKQTHRITLIKGKVKGYPVHYISVGYLAFYYVTADGKSAALWNRQQQRWEPMEPESRRHLQKLWRMEKRQQPYGWVSLPFQSPRVVYNGPKATTVLTSGTHQLVFSDQERRRIVDQVLRIYKQLEVSPLSLLHPAAELRHLNTSSLTVNHLLNILNALWEQLELSAQSSYISLSSEKLPVQFSEQRFLFTGPFSVIADDLFFYKDPISGLLTEAEEQPGIGLSLQATALYHNKKPSLAPIDPLYGKLLIKEDQLPDSFEYLSGSHFLTWALCLLGILGCCWAFLRLGVLACMSWRISKQVRKPGEYWQDNPLGCLVMNCHYEPSERWINVMHETLSKEKHIHARREKRLMLLTLIIASTGLLLTMFDIIRAVSLSALSGEILVSALIPLVLSIALCIALLAMHALLIVCHRFFLLKLERVSWAFLFERMKSS